MQRRVSGTDSPKTEGYLLLTVAPIVCDHVREALGIKDEKLAGGVRLYFPIGTRRQYGKLVGRRLTYKICSVNDTAASGEVYVFDGDQFLFTLNQEVYDTANGLHGHKLKGASLRQWWGRFWCWTSTASNPTERYRLLVSPTSGKYRLVAL